MNSNNKLLIVASLAYDGIDTGEQKIDHILGGAGTYICLSVKHFNLSSAIWLSQIFYIWCNVYSFFVVSIFWVVIINLFRGEGAANFFGVIAAR
mgnify:CR=1 FL=1